MYVGVQQLPFCHNKCGQYNDIIIGGNVGELKICKRQWRDLGLLHVMGGEVGLGPSKLLTPPALEGWKDQSCDEGDFGACLPTLPCPPPFMYVLTP